MIKGKLLGGDEVAAEEGLIQYNKERVLKNIIEIFVDFEGNFIIQKIDPVEDKHKGSKKIWACGTKILIKF